MEMEMKAWDGGGLKGLEMRSMDGRLIKQASSASHYRE